MRLFAIVAVCLVIGCSRTASQPAGADASARPEGPAAQAASAPPPVSLYTDQEIRRLAQFDIDKESGNDRRLLDTPYLDVVPAGESRPRETVFKALGIDDGRVRDFRTSRVNSVAFLSWQVSPSYDIVCMTGTNDPGNDGLEMTDPRRKVYGIRLIRRPK